MHQNELWKLAYIELCVKLSKHQTTSWSIEKKNVSERNLNSLNTNKGQSKHTESLLLKVGFHRCMCKRRAHSFINVRDPKNSILHLKPQRSRWLLTPPLITPTDRCAILSVWVPPPSHPHPTSHPVPQNQDPNFTHLLTNVTNGLVRQGMGLRERVRGEGKVGR